MISSLFVLFATFALALAEKSPTNPDYNQKAAITFGVVGASIIVLFGIISVVQRYHNSLEELANAKKKKAKMEALAAKAIGAEGAKGNNPIRGSMGINK